jgi:hypothetical protein
MMFITIIMQVERLYQEEERWTGERERWQEEKKKIEVSWSIP